MSLTRNSSDCCLSIVADHWEQEGAIRGILLSFRDSHCQGVIDSQVKGGGHATNPGFSSTFGIQIAMTRFSEVSYDANTQTVKIGAGLIWDDVYTFLEPHGVNVVGGRVSGIGVAGFTLGGGKST